MSTLDVILPTTPARLSAIFHATRHDRMAHMGPHILQHVLTYANSQMLGRAAAVSRTWHSATQNGSVHVDVVRCVHVGDVMMLLCASDHTCCCINCRHVMAYGHIIPYDIM